MRAALRWYGAGPLHLLVSLFALALAGTAVLRLASAGGLSPVLSVGLWLVGAAVLHDLVLVPAYSLLDRGLVAALRRRRSGTPARPEVSALNHVRVPLALSLLLLGMFFPLVLGTQSERYRASTGLSGDVYLSRYLAVVAALAGAGLLTYLVRVMRSRS